MGKSKPFVDDDDLTADFLQLKQEVLSHHNELVDLRKDVTRVSSQQDVLVSSMEKMN